MVCDGACQRGGTGPVCRCLPAHRTGPPGASPTGARPLGARPPGAPGGGEMGWQGRLSLSPRVGARWRRRPALAVLALLRRADRLAAPLRTDGPGGLCGPFRGAGRSSGFSCLRLAGPPLVLSRVACHQFQQNLANQPGIDVIANQHLADGDGQHETHLALAHLLVALETRQHRFRVQGRPVQR